MRRRLIILVFLGIFVFSACGEKEDTAVKSIASGEALTYNSQEELISPNNITDDEAVKVPARTKDEIISSSEKVVEDANNKATKTEAVSNDSVENSENVNEEVRDYVEKERELPYLAGLKKKSNVYSGLQCDVPIFELEDYMYVSVISDYEKKDGSSAPVCKVEYSALGDVGYMKVDDLSFDVEQEGDTDAPESVDDSYIPEGLSLTGTIPTEKDMDSIGFTDEDNNDFDDEDVDHENQIVEGE